MKSKNYNYIIFFISLTIIATIGLQLFWNVKNYKENKVRFINEVQIALDNSVENYYVEDVKNDFVAYINSNDSIKTEDFIQSVQMDSLFKYHKALRHASKKKVKKDSIKASTIIEYKVNSTFKTKSLHEKENLDSGKKQLDSASKINSNNVASLTVFYWKKISR
jgi:hypothetical protein